MPQYEGYTIPGVDHLCRYSAYITADMQVVSAAAQNGQKQVLTETFGCSGWNFNMRGMKWLYQQHLVHGINLLCQHLAGYSLHGLRKRDYPASLFYQHPMWAHIKELNDSFSRVGRMLATGGHECEILLIHGESSAWMRSHGHFQDRFSKTLFQEFCQLSQGLSVRSVPFHYGDEIMLSEKGSVAGKRLQLGKMSYSCVVIPPVENLLKSTMTLLMEFARQGGRVLKLTSPAAEGFFVDGDSPSHEERLFWEKISAFDNRKQLLDSLQDIPTLSIHNVGSEDGRVRGTWRRFPERKERWYYLADFAFLPENRIPDEDFWTELHSNVPEVNTPCALAITLPFPTEKAEIIDQRTGEVTEQLKLLRHPDGKCSFLKQLAASESLLICARDLEEKCTLDLTKDWSCRTENNVMTLDKVSFRLSPADKWSEPLDTLAVFNRLLALPEDSDIGLRYSFCVLPELELKKASLKMALEPDHNAEYYLNGHQIAGDFEPGFFIDRSIKILHLPVEMLFAGNNIFEVRTHFVQSRTVRKDIERAKNFESEANKLYYDSEVESVYLLGQFGCFTQGNIREEKKNSFYLAEPFVLGAMPEKLDPGHAVTGGFPFFTGALILEKNFLLDADQVSNLKRLELSPFKANDAVITVNGHMFPVMYAPPYHVELAGLLREGKNRIVLRLETSCRNTLGPLHTPETEPYYTGPGSFLTEKDLLDWYCIPAVEEYGLLEFTPDQIRLTSC